MIRRISSFTCAVAPVVVALIASAAPAEAQSRPFDRGLRIGVATDLVAHGEQETTFPGSFGGSSAVTRTTSYGLGMPRVGIDLGGFPLRWLGLGVALSVGQVEQTVPSGGTLRESDLLEFAVLPYAEARIPLLDILSLQVRLNFGAVGTEQTVREAGSFGASTVDGAQFAIGAQAGLHVFPAESFSISPYFGFRYTTGDGSFRSTGSSRVDSFGLEGWQVTLGVALFGWIDLAGGGEPDAVEPVEDVRAMPTQPAPAPAPVVAAAPVPSAEPVVAGDVMATDLAIPGATARILGNVTTGDARLELRTTAAQPRFATCTEALLSSDGRSALVPVRVQATQTLTGFEETLLITGRPEQLDALRGENARIELCGIRVDVDANNRYRIGRLLAALRMASPAAHGSPPATQPPAPAPAAPATGLTSPSP